MKQSDRITDPAIAALRFQPIQLTRARELRCLTKTALADLIGKTPSALTQFESVTSGVRPDGKTLAQLALALGVPVGFLARQPLVGRAALDSCHFRSLRSVGQARRRQALRVGELVQEVAHVVESIGVEFPSDRVSSMRRPVKSLQEIEALALATRREWGLGIGPIHTPIPLFEAVGIRVLPLTSVCDGVDAFSTWYGETPLMFLSLTKPSSRIHFDAAHELGHLLMHEDVSSGDIRLEREANQFAASLLLPSSSFSAECPNRWSLATFFALKSRWRVSVQALLYRAHKLGGLSTASYRRAFQEMNRRGLRKNEGEEWNLDGPTALASALELASEELPMLELAQALELHESQLIDLLTPILCGVG